MRLKTLEIKGFKSFATETAIHFDEDVIGIVGPNEGSKAREVLIFDEMELENYLNDLRNKQ